MEQQPPLDVATYFAAGDDPHVERTKRHKLQDMSDALELIELSKYVI